MTDLIFTFVKKEIMISVGDLIQIIFLLGAIIGVWARGEIKIATLTERVRGNEEKRKEDKSHVNTIWQDFKNVTDKIFEKLSHIEERINNKQDKN